MSQTPPDDRPESERVETDVPHPEDREMRAFAQAMFFHTPRLIAIRAVVALNVLIYAAMVVAGVDWWSPNGPSLIDWGANYGPYTLNGEPWRLATSLFLHFGAMHLAFNMYVAWNVGPLVERLIGAVGFAVLYLTAGVGGSLASLAWNPEAISAGASGAVFGIAGAILGLIVRSRGTIPEAMVAGLKRSVGMFVFYNLLFGLAMPNIDMAAHFGGLVVGFLAGLALRHPLTPEQVGRRGFRNAALAAVAAVLAPLVFLAFPDPPPDYVGEMRRFAETEQQVVAAYNSLQQQANRESMPAIDYAERLDREVVSPWRQTRERMESLAVVPGRRQASIERLAEYMRRREEAWRLLAAGQLAQDQERIRQAMVKSAEADELAKRLSEK